METPIPDVQRVLRAHAYDDIDTSIAHLAERIARARAAIDGHPCPDDGALARAYGTSSPGRVRRLIDYMEKLGVIVARTDFSGKRSIGLPGLGLSTAAAEG